MGVMLMNLIRIKRPSQSIMTRFDLTEMILVHLSPRLSFVLNLHRVFHGDIAVSSQHVYYS
jgi:hypothetical protein